MKVQRKGTNDAIALRLRLSMKTTEELQQILLRRDPGNTRRFANDVKTRNAATAVLKARRTVATDEPWVPTSDPTLHAHCPKCAQWFPVVRADLLTRAQIEQRGEDK